jgi:transketolase
MRNTFINYLVKAAQNNSNIYLIIGDLGFSIVDEFKIQFPQRFINAGISEQAMIGLSAGLAMTGKNVFAYSIVPFVTLRCFEQIRNNICYQELPIKLLGVGGGLSYDTAGLTHHALEDIAVMKSLAHMQVIAPGNKHETTMLAKKIINSNKPVYLRLSNTHEDKLMNTNQKLFIGKAHIIIPHKKNLIITTGNSLYTGIQVYKQLKSCGIEIGVISMHTIKPLDIDFLKSIEPSIESIFTIEEHSVIGGLGESIGNFIAQNYSKKIIFQSFGIQDFYFHEAGSRDYLLEKAGLSPEIITKKILEIITRTKSSKNARILRQAQDERSSIPE